MLKHGCGGLHEGRASIGKYFLTGVLPAFRSSLSPLNETIIISNRSRFHGICGFTEEEVKTIVHRLLNLDAEEEEAVIYGLKLDLMGIRLLDPINPPAPPQDPPFTVPKQLLTIFPLSRTMAFPLISPHLLMSIPQELSHPLLMWESSLC